MARGLARLQRARAAVLAAVLATLGLAATAAERAPAAPQRVALVVGNAHYVDVPALDNALNDAADMCAALRELGFEVACVSDVKTRRDFKRELQAFRDRLGPGRMALFYYAGHGLQIDGENFLLPTAAQIRRKEDVEDESVSLRFVMATLEDAQSDFTMMILDACRNSPFTRGFSRSVSRGLAPVSDAPVGSLVLYATAANETASDGEPGARNSPFTKHLLANLRQPGLPVETMIKRVSAGVQQETQRNGGKRQVPFTYGSFTGEFCFAGCGVAAAETAPLPARPPEIVPPAAAAPAPRQLPAAAPPRGKVVVPPAF
ncbi:MAG: caspase family protein [Rubrivivax sp.]